jgi:hypothetical protein
VQSTTAQIASGTITINNSLYPPIVLHGDGTATNVIQRGSGMTAAMFDVASSGSLTIGGSGNLTIAGNNATTVAIVGVNSGIFTLNSGATLTGNKFTAVSVDGGTFTMSGGTITDNSSSNGGGVMVASGGAFNFYGGKISKNTASGVGGGIYSLGTLVVGNGSGTPYIGGSSSSEGNSAASGSGVYIAGGTFTFNNGEISNNTKQAVDIAKGAFTMNGGKITGGWAATGGGGVNIKPSGSDAANFEMKGGEISGNFCQSTTKGAGAGGVYVSGANASFTMSGGTIEKNIGNAGSVTTFPTAKLGVVPTQATNGSGGGVCIASDGNFIMSGNAVIRQNVACYGGGIYVYSLSSGSERVRIAGGTITNNYAHHGAGIGFSSAGSGAVTMASGTVSGNASYAGGGGLNLVSSTVTLDGALLSISGNSTQFDTDSSGGGMKLASSTLIFKQGTVSGNTKVNGTTGLGISLDSTTNTIKMGKDAKVTTDNDVRLGSNTQTIESIDGSFNNIAARITPSAYTVGLPVISVSPATTYEKFTVTSKGTEYWAVLSNGKLCRPVASIDGTIYSTLKSAFDAASSIMPTMITLIADVDNEDKMGGVSSISIGSNKNIILIPESDGDKTIKRWSGNTGNLFIVSGGTLVLRGSGGKTIAVDGGAVWTGNFPTSESTGSGHLNATGALVSVSGGTFELKDGAILQNNDQFGSLSGSGIYVTGGTFDMTGGEIRRNRAKNQAYGGGALAITAGTGHTFSGGSIHNNMATYVSDYAGGGGILMAGGTLTMSGTASINDNRVPNGGGGAVLIRGGRLIMTNGSIIDNYSRHPGNVIAGGGVLMGSGTFDMTGGTIAGNSAAHDGGVSNGGAVFIWSSNCTFTMSDAALINQNNDVCLATGAPITISTNLTYNPAAKITPASYTLGTQLLTGSVVSTNYNKFTLSALGWYIDSVGILRNTP